MWTILLLILGGMGLNWVANKCRGKNARMAFRYASWGTWLILLKFLSPIVPLIWPLSTIVLLVPSVICFYLAAMSMLKEMRAQKVGAYTERA
jgi:hypothetical protein